MAKILSFKPAPLIHHNSRYLNLELWTFNWWRIFNQIVLSGQVKIICYDFDKNDFYFPIHFTKCILQQNIMGHTIKIIIIKVEEGSKCFP